jgi:hypothetical protein
MDARRFVVRVRLVLSNTIPAFRQGDQCPPDPLSTTFAFGFLHARDSATH